MALRAPSAQINTPIERLKGVSTTILKPLKNLGIGTYADLLLHIPTRYDDFSHVTRIADAPVGETVTVRGAITSIENIRSWKRRMYITHATISDGSGELEAVWFNQPFLTQTLTQGKTVSLSGKISISDRSGLTMQNPAHEVIGKTNTTTHTGRLVPVYRETAGITSRWLRYLIKNAFATITTTPETLPEDIIKRQHFPSRFAALTSVHFPATEKEAALARRRLAFEEVFFMQLLMLRARETIKQADAPKIPINVEKIKTFVGALPFSLTDAQRKAAWEIVQDMERGHPMNRLLEGDVGSGKTVVAAIAMYNAAEHGWQSVIMAPTEVLASQHFSSFSKLLEPFNINVGLLTGSGALMYDAELKTAHAIKKADILASVRSGNLKIIIGTHALIANAFSFHSLGLIVLDEQHRFGVKQRAQLAQHRSTGKSTQEPLIPHFLSMTATPIPRTLTLTAYGDLDISILNEIPQNRKVIVTKLISPAARTNAYTFMDKQMDEGRQIFVICPRIEHEPGSDALSLPPRQFTFAEIARKEVKAVKKEYEKLSQEIFPERRIGMLHGKMKAKEKEDVMKKFKAHELDILVSTSVIEVGVDVPNASVMAIEGAERFGLAQLHQFRGRVGRSEHQSYCLLFQDDASQSVSRRLKALLECNDGFLLAEKDLAIRGPGDFLGTRQWGAPDLAMASLTDVALIKAAREEALRILSEDPALRKHPTLLTYLAAFTEKVHLE
ncbi:ATP-dependent DNA helicase RecG [Candidatus Azambacteria bacterium]|nr:ATP-dependent DNA helicase RecG [Candidatus Azambacteria bacterium]